MAYWYVATAAHGGNDANLGNSWSQAVATIDSAVLTNVSKGDKLIIDSEYVGTFDVDLVHTSDINLDIYSVEYGKSYKKITQGARFDPVGGGTGSLYIKNTSGGQKISMYGMVGYNTEAYPAIIVCKGNQFVGENCGVDFGTFVGVAKGSITLTDCEVLTSATSGVLVSDYSEAGNLIDEFYITLLRCYQYGAGNKLISILNGNSESLTVKQSIEMSRSLLTGDYPFDLVNFDGVNQVIEEEMSTYFGCTSCKRIDSINYDKTFAIDSSIFSNVTNIVTEFSANSKINTLNLTYCCLDTVSAPTDDPTEFKVSYKSDSISSDPWFEDEVAENFNLKAKSPCINRGNPTLTDPDLTRADIGAFYYSFGTEPEEPYTPLTLNLLPDLSLKWVN
jgi:hypothetical protein